MSFRPGAAVNSGGPTPATFRSTRYTISGRDTTPTTSHSGDVRLWHEKTIFFPSGE
jgi:hypothetical protein